jgi:hypothetical protein
MAKIKQFTIAIENRPGAVAEIAKILGNAKVNILALLGTALGTAGTLQLIAEDVSRAKKVLDDAGLTYTEIAAHEYELQNKPGALADCLEKLSAKGINLNSIYATVPKSGKKAVVVYSAEAAAAEAAATASA